MTTSAPTPIFDIVIPVGPSDVSQIENQLKFTRKNIVGYRKIYIIINNNMNFVSTSTDINVIRENKFPFSLKSIEQVCGQNSRNGWYMQQLFKLYAGICIPGISERYLALDADTYFLKPTTFFSDDGKRCLYATGTENHQPYFGHMKRLDPSFRRFDNGISGICHHMMFDTKYVKEIFKLVETRHLQLFWIVFLRMVNRDEYHQSGASEYEIYLNFLLNRYRDKDVFSIRQLRWINTYENPMNISNSNSDYVAWHHYMR